MTTIHYTLDQLNNMDSIDRLKLINAVSGVKPANLIGSISESGQTNLAIFNSVFHLGSNPPLQGFILRPTGEVPRHTYENLVRNREYTINHVSMAMIERGHYTSAKFGKEVTEFESCCFEEEYLAGFEAPFVKESSLKIGMRFIEALPIKANDTLMVIGEIQHVLLAENSYGEEKDIDLERINGVGISGLNTYYKLKKLARFPYARVGELPNFEDQS